VTKIEDLAVQFGAILAARVTEGRGVDGLRPQQRIGLLLGDGLIGQREVGVQHARTTA
jgi:hypothetical protein